MAKNIIFGTHDSATGEKGYWLWRPFTWLCKTQTLCIKDQALKGCKYFDLRVKKTCRGYVCAHGLWTTKKLFTEILADLKDMEDIYVSVTYEGHLDDSKYAEFIKYAKSVIPENIKLTFIAVKYAKIGKFKRGWKTLETVNYLPTKGLYPCFDFSNWKTLFAIPFLWKGFKVTELSNYAVNVIDFFE